jgi:hypothetical protein
MTHPKMLNALTIATGLVLAGAAHASNVEWSASVGMPVPVQVVMPAPVYAPAPSPILPNIEQIQAQQQARIQWGTSAGLITGHEYNRLQQTQGYIEQQRQWAYADGWLTYDEHLNLMNLLNGSAQQIERSLVNWQRVNTAYYPMPPALTVWSAPRPQYWHHGHHQQGAAPVQAPIRAAVPVQPVNQRKAHVPMVAPMPPVIQPVQPIQPQHRGHQESQILDKQSVRY